MSGHLDISRTAAVELIKGGHVEVNGRVILKPAAPFAEGNTISVNGGFRSFVSRGGDKLEAALLAFNIDVSGLRCLDVGASTGGFTDCLLKRGATLVYAVDNGVGQLAETLRADPRVTSMEEVDIREIGNHLQVDFAVVDVSFISLTKVLEYVAALANEMICLIKPQYEGAKVNKRGIVKDPKARQKTVDAVNDFACGLGLKCFGTLPYPQKDKNEEFLVHYKKEGF